MRRVGQPSMPHLNYGFDFRVEYKDGRFQLYSREQVTDI